MRLLEELKILQVHLWSEEILKMNKKEYLNDKDRESIS